jgi:hypothetical protein
MPPLQWPGMYLAPKVKQRRRNAVVTAEPDDFNDKAYSKDDDEYQEEQSSRSRFYMEAAESSEKHSEMEYFGGDSETEGVLDEARGMIRKNRRSTTQETSFWAFQENTSR